MKNNVLVINSGSSSLKFKLYDSNLSEQISGIVERIGIKGCFLEFISKLKSKRINKFCKDHKEALKLVLLKISEQGFDLQEIKVIGHRVVHGGNELFDPIIINQNVLKKIQKAVKLAPLHNPANITCIKSCMELLPKVKQAAVFDTGLYKTLPDYAKLYGLPLKFYKKYQIQRFGFHGISHQYVSEIASQKLKKPLSHLNLITCHLGSGCSITAFKNGIAVDTSMGFTPLEGIMMMTRCGDLDPAILIFLNKEYKYSMAELDEILNKKSGLKGITGKKDLRDILDCAGYNNSGRKYSKKQQNISRLAIDIFIYKIKKYIGAYYAILGKVDAIVFTAGIGERSSVIRQKITKNLPIKAKILVIPTNEELMIAKQAVKITTKKV